MQETMFNLVQADNTVILASLVGLGICAAAFALHGMYLNARSRQRFARMIEPSQRMKLH